MRLGAHMSISGGVDTAFDRGEQVGCEYAECFVPMEARGAVKPYPVLP